MREILFRAKTARDPEWIYGDLLHDGFDYDVAIWEEKNKLVTAIQPQTVGQYTGLTDKNGVKIFEGDIVVYDNTPYNAYGHRVTGVIVWHKWAWRCKYKEYGSTYHYTVGAEDFFGAKSEVIGNIHDHPELLGGADNG